MPVEKLGRFFGDLLGRILAWAAQNPGAALLVFVLIFIGGITIFAVKKTRS